MKKANLGVYALMLVLVFICLPVGIWAGEEATQPPFPDYCPLCGGACQFAEPTVINEATGGGKMHSVNSATGTVEELFFEIPQPETPDVPGTKTDVGDANLQANAPTEMDAFDQVTNNAQVPAEQSKVVTPGTAGEEAGDVDIAKLPQVLAEVPTALAVWWDGLSETENGVLIRVVCIVVGALLVIAIILSMLQGIHRRLKQQKRKREQKIVGGREEQ